MTPSTIRSRWAALGAAIAVVLGAGGFGIGHATTSSGEKPIFVPIEPCRLLDTRPAEGVGGRTAPIGPDETYPRSGWGTQGDCTIPSGTTGLALNVTAVAPTLATYLTFFPTDASSPPTASNLNPTPGQPPTPNAVHVDLDATGSFSIYNFHGSVHVIVDVVGYYDDHDHDDRYYTQDEVDALVAASKPVAAYAGGASTVFGIDADTVVKTATIDVPSNGTVIASAVTTVVLGTSVTELACALGLGTTADEDFRQYVESAGGTTVDEVQGVRQFVVEPGPTTVNFVCLRTQGSGTSIAGRTQLSLLFVPN